MGVRVIFTLPSPLPRKQRSQDTVQKVDQRLVVCKRQDQEYEGCVNQELSLPLHDSKRIDLKGLVMA